MRWALHYSRSAVNGLYHQVERRFVKEVTAAIKALADNPTPMNMQVSEEDPSIYWIAVPGDYIVFYEIVDEEQFIRILDIE